MPTITVKCESWCVDHDSDEVETCSVEPAFFGPEVDYGPVFGGVGRAGEVFAYRVVDEPTSVVIQAASGGRGGAFIDVDALRHIHAALLIDPDGFADAMAAVLKDVDA